MQKFLAKIPGRPSIEVHCAAAATWRLRPNRVQDLEFDCKLPVDAVALSARCDKTLR